MSRIERALEKAASLRNTSDSHSKQEDSGARATAPAPRDHIPPPPPPAGEIVSKVENPMLATLCEPHSPVSEEYRKLKSALIAFVNGDGFRNVIMVTSSVSGEGKSLTSLNLAITLAQEIDHTVLLVDADLRKPSIQSYLGTTHTKGLSDHLADGTPISDLLIRTGIGRLSVLPAGTPMKNPVELFSSQKMKDFVHEIKNRYPDRFVIIDTPPLLPFAETRSLASVVDGIVFVVREGQTTRENIVEAVSYLDGAKLCGSVYNAATVASLNGRYHSYYYGYGYGQGEGIESSGKKGKNKEK